MQASEVIACQTIELSRSGRCSLQETANRQPGGQAAGFDSRTQMLLEKPIATTIMRLAIPNAAVMTVQVLIGLLEVYFVWRTGVDALAGVAPVFPLVSLVLAIAQ